VIFDARQLTRRKCALGQAARKKRAPQGLEVGVCIAFLCTVLGAEGQNCAGAAPSSTVAADCVARSVPSTAIATLDPKHPYTVLELIDIGEHNNPRTRIVWERAKQRAAELGIAKSAYYPVLAFQAIGGDSRSIAPFPKPLAPRGYTMAETPITQPSLTLDYVLFDFGKRTARVETAVAEKIAAGADFVQANQEVAFRVASAFYKLLDAQERLQATKETLKTAQTTQDAAEFQLANGRSTLPDVLNARAETAQAVFDMESADGEEKIARVSLSEQVGAEPSPDIVVEPMSESPLPEELTVSVEELIKRAVADRPDLASELAKIHAAEARIRVAKREYLPTVGLAAVGSETSIWPTSDFGQLGSTTQSTWSVALALHWNVFDGGLRRNEVQAALSRRREDQDRFTEIHDQAVREVWTSYIAFRTALKKQEAATSLLKAATESYGASLDAYKFGVKNLIDVVTAERQLAQARQSSVSARSQLFLGAVDLEFVTGNLLRSLPPATRLQAPNGSRP